jgi:methionyl-tRNA formyltransferase
VAVAAQEAAGVQLLRALAMSGHRTACVLTSPPGVGGHGATVWHVAQSLGLTMLPPRLVKDPAFAGGLRELGVDLLLNVHSLFVAHQDVLAAPKIGSFNLHPGPLPRYAGLNAPSWAILRGERQHGVTVHWMAPEIDAGPVAYQTLFPIGESDTGFTVSARCVREGLPLLRRLLAQAAADPSGIPRIAQDATQREYFGREIPFGGLLSWSRRASEVHALVRAADFHPLRSPWGSPRTHLGNTAIGIVRASRTGETADAPPGTVTALGERDVGVACADEWILVSLVRVEDRTIEAREALRPGDRLTDAR